ncbi:AMP-binding protein [uncultured Limosilactobacillus sp.]|uniref:AMP-binding protein n=1 Tax=uncultured Limosilactobacillus sp. TaxID=2837629 RepID=UPI0025FD2624|nr:AMP-binding protein [uncultured Limosilactobacillus sp.]
MTKLTHDLKAQLTNNWRRPVVKDIRLGRWFTGEDLENDIQTLQAVFQTINLSVDDVVFMALANTAAYLPINQALWRYGMTAHPVSATSTAAELVADYEEHQYPAMIFTDEMATAFEGRDDLNSVLVTLETFPEGLVILSKKTNRNDGRLLEPNEESLGWILNTSGTTGKPKQVGLPHKFMWQAAQDDAYTHRMTSDDTVLIVMPMFHINAQELIINSMLLVSGRIVIAPKFSASKFWHWINEDDCTWSSVVPTIVTILLKNEASKAEFNPNHHLRFIRCASAMLPVGRHEQFVNEFKVPILEGYGMTESCSQCTLNPLDAIKLGSVGIPYGSEVKIVTDNGYTDDPQVEGEIAIRGPHVITEYLNGDERAQKDFHDGWFHTGDLGYFDEDGYLWLNGRKKHLINHGGEKVNPTLVEDVIGELDYVKNVAVVPTPDEIYGKAVTAVVILQDDQKKSNFLKHQIMEYAATKLAKYRLPTAVYFVDEFPLNPTGKIMRPQLSQQVTQLMQAELAV